MALVDNLFAYWKCDEASGNIIDQVGSNDLTNNGASYGATGKLGNALTFDGTNDYLNVAATKTFSAFTVSAWIKDDGNIDNWGGVVNFDTLDLMFRRFSSGNKIHAQMLAPADPVVQSTDVVIDGAFHLIVVTWSGTTMELWVDNVSQGTDTNTSRSQAITTIEIGRSEKTNNQSWGGIMGSIGIWDVVKSDADLTTLWNEGSGIEHPFTVAAAGNSPMMGANF